MRNSLARILTFTLITFVGMTSQAQTNVVMSNGEFFSCGGVFLDSGGQGGPGYSNGEYFTCTICPETEGDVVTIDFITFDLDQSGAENTWDSMAIFDGDNTGESTLGSYTGTALQGLFVTATPQNTSGCLTFVFQSNGTGTGNFGGSITCETPCDRPTAEATYDAPDNKRICVGDVINFDGSASTAADGFVIEEWLWDFADGTSDTSGPIVSHSWDEPGEYIVELYLVDDNGCASTNRISLQVLVATYPSWDPFPNDTTLCLGEQLCLEAFPNDYEVTWSGPDLSYANAENIELLDNVGECFVSEIDVTGFAPGQTLTNINDLMTIDISIEHSWLFDLVVTVTCPTGESVIMHQQMQQPDGTDVGANGTDLGVPDTEFWDYSWSADATAGTWSQVATDLGFGGGLPEDNYNSLEPMEQLVGCDLNGIWSIEICDLWGGDNGELNSWGLNFNPAIIPDVTEFTPEIGLASDSSYWTYDDTNLDIISAPDDGNSVCFQPLAEGDYPFTYTVTNNHGCSHDSTIVVTAELAGQADAGPDITFCGEATQLSGGLDGQPSSSCNNDGGNYTYCYSNGGMPSFTYCPDNPGDGITFIDITFNAGSVENFFDEFWVYDGDNTGAPILAGPIYGDLTGLQFVATNPTGCLTIQVTPDGSVDCAGGSQTEWDYDVGCSAGGPQYEYSWSPIEGLSDPNSPTPFVESISGETTYTLTTFPTGHPDCASTDEVTVFPAFAFNVESFDPSCFGNDAVISVDIDPDSGTGPWTIEFSEDGVLQETINSEGGLTEFEDLFPGNYAVSVSDGGCTYDNDIVINSPPPLMFELSNDTTICVDGMATLSATSDMDIDDSWQYTWDGGLGLGNPVFAEPLETTTYNVFATDDAGCDSDPIAVTVEVRDSITVEISGTELICGGTEASLQVDDTQGGLGAPYDYIWQFNGVDVANGEDISVQQFQTGTYCVFATDGCESPAGEACLDVVVETPLNVAFTADTLVGCFPADIQFTNLIDATAYESALWDFEDGSFSTEADPLHQFELPGFYDVSLTLTTAPGCVYSTVYPNYITVYDNPTAGYHAQPQPTTMPDTEIEFYDYSVGDVVDWYWVFDTLNVQGTSTLPDPVFQFPMSTGGNYPVTLTITDSNGCTDQITRWIVINDLLNIYVPNSFTPNNDGVNDIFLVEGSDIDPDRFELKVFSRWGDKVFESTDMTVPWNGNYQGGGYFSQNDMYIWQLVVHSLSTSERFELSGTVTILR
ncbi:MAG: PKD domain-containing protein [Flavobacteriales bacterium]|nr:PKD domain-containing protein [Flavobacteriales bacterium]